MDDAHNAFARLVPGYDFLQNLVKSAGAAMPGAGSWVAPTLDPDEIEKRISELRTVQFWLEQNARLLGTTIQALEVQKMTLSTLKSMNVSFADLTESLKVRPAAAAPPPAPAPSPAPAAPAPTPTAAAPADAGDAPSAPAAGAVDPLKWWGALTQQFTQLATTAMQESAADAARHLAAAGQPAAPAAAEAGPAPAPAKASRRGAAKR